MKLKNKILPLVGAVSLVFGSVGVDQLNGFAMSPLKTKSVKVALVGDRDDEANKLGILKGITNMLRPDTVRPKDWESKHLRGRFGFFEMRNKRYDLSVYDWENQHEPFMLQYIRKLDAVCIVLVPDTFENMKNDFNDWYNKIDKITGVPIFVLVNINNDAFYKDSNIRSGVDEFLKWNKKESFHCVNYCDEVDILTGGGICNILYELGKIEPSASTADNCVDLIPSLATSSNGCL